jgi:RNA polymerase-binding transcription factor DksA
MAVKSIKKAAKKKAAPAKKAAKKATTKKAAPAKKKATKKATKKKAAPAKKAAKKTAKKVAKKKAAPAKKKVAKKKAAPAKKVAKKKAAPAKKVAEKKAAKVVVPKPVVVKVPKVTKAQLAAIAKAEAAAAAALAGPPVQVINPIGSVGLPSVRKAVPGTMPEPKHPVVQEDESNWTQSELNAVRKLLQGDAEELMLEIAKAEESFHALIFESGEGAGDDQADAGTKTFEREHEISILSNKKDLLDQTNRALERIDAGTYGVCENCGKQIGKLRLQEANTRATLCMPCRERQDRS